MLTKSQQIHSFAVEMYTNKIHYRNFKFWTIQKAMQAVMIQTPMHSWKHMHCISSKTLDEWMIRNCQVGCQRTKSCEFQAEKNIYYSLLIYELNKCMNELDVELIQGFVMNEQGNLFSLIQSLWHAWEWSDITAKQTKSTHGFMFHLMSARGFLIASKDCIVTHNL